MKHALLVLTLLPFTLFGRHTDPRIRQEAPYAGVKLVKTTTFFTLPKEGNKLDTCIKESHLYNQDGLLVHHDFSMVMQKNPRYDYQEKIAYTAEDAWTKREFRQGFLIDSIVVNGSRANYYFFKENKIHALYEYRGDSMQEKMINSGDTLFRAKKPFTYFNRDDFWDYANAGSFARKAVMHDKDGAATVTYFNEKDEALVSYTEHRVMGGKVSQVDYFNYRVKRFDFKRLTYSDKMEMNFFLEKSKKGKPSYQIYYTYNDKNQLVEEKWVDGNPKKNQVVIKYEYEFYF